MSNTGYRRHLKHDLIRVENGLPATGFDDLAFVSLMRVFRDKLRTSIVRGSVTYLMNFVYEHLKVSATMVDGEQLACRKGCAHCCNIWIDAYAPEVFFAARRMTGMKSRELNLNFDQMDRFISFGDNSGFPSPCPLLIENECSSYLQRPLNCRTAMSFDDESCRRAFMENEEIEIPVPAASNDLGQAYSLALKGAMLHAGLQHEPYEWRSALRLAANDRLLEQKWLQGNAVFEQGATKAGEGAFDHPFWRRLYHEAFLG